MTMHASLNFKHDVRLCVQATPFICDVEAVSMRPQWICSGVDGVQFSSLRLLCCPDVVQLL